ncbi:MAG TPA: lasso peptide biosynthesis B2 protein [Thermoanaerobaculia bacterium]|jgi:hypothetical protein|nr:lasso peptide biosynthesis B2 protein [Thermoanaerobaculia bacterium]
MKQKLARWLASSPQERRLLLEAWWLLLLAGAALRLLPLRRVQDVLRPRLASSPSRQPEVTVERMARLVDRAARHHVRRTACLERSLALQVLLARRGCSSELKIGVRRDGETLHAHAWIEVAGKPVGDAPDVAGEFRPFPGALAP